MKKKIIVFLLFAFILSCTKKTEETFSYTFVENSMLEIENNLGRIVDGTNLVFLYEYNAEDEINTQDDEYSEFIRFEIEPTIEEFNYSDNELLDIKAVYWQSCFCPLLDDEQNIIAPKGTISGEKLSQTEWSITIDVTFNGESQKNVSNTFKLEK